MLHHGLDEMLERSPDGHFLKHDVVSKSDELIAYKGSDTRTGVEVVWNVVVRDPQRSEKDQECLSVRIERFMHVEHSSFGSVLSKWNGGDGINYITEKISSSSLAEYLQQAKEANFVDVKKWSKQLIAGLDNLHSQQLVHGDIKCSSIHVKEDTGDLKIGLPSFSHGAELTESMDILAIGMCILAMVRGKTSHAMNRDPTGLSRELSQDPDTTLLEEIDDWQTRRFLDRCLSVQDKPLSVKDLLTDPFLEDQPVADFCSGSQHMHRPKEPVLSGETTSQPKKKNSAIPFTNPYRHPVKAHHRRNTSEPLNFVHTSDVSPLPPPSPRPNPQFRHRRNASDPSVFAQMNEFSPPLIYYDVPHVHHPQMFVSAPHYAVQSSNGHMVPVYSKTHLAALGHPSPPYPPTYLVPVQYSVQPYYQTPHPSHMQVLPNAQQHNVPPPPPPPQPPMVSRPMPTNRQVSNRHRRLPTFTSSPLEPSTPSGGIRRISSEPFFAQMDGVSKEDLTEGQPEKKVSLPVKSALSNDILAYVAPERELLGKIMQEEKKKQETRAQLCHMLEARSECIVPALV
mmetsp:Transcript_42913/g.69620  ORF Transcript_42913/g.69620 Transcript_42913/m.69620 type:complete len:567 (-) Transcript_42913:404-2104(-)